MAIEPEGTMSILLVEDNEIDVEITKRVLAKSEPGIDLTVARDGKEALDLLFQRPETAREAGRTQLILLDLRLPLMDGRELLRRIKDHPELGAIPVAVLTGMGGERTMLECLALGGNMYFSKPITAADAAVLLPAVRKYWAAIARARQAGGGGAGPS